MKIKGLDALEGRHFGKLVSEDLVERYWAIPQLVPRNPCLKILDAGAGDGYITSKLKAKGHDAIAMEAASINIKHLKERGIPVIPHDLTQSPYPIKDESFDLVICAAVLEHLYRPDICLQEFHRILKHDGGLIVSTPNYSHPYRIWQLVKGETFHDPLKEYQFWAHLRFFTYKTLVKFLEHLRFFVADVFLPLPAVPAMYSGFTKGSKIKEFFALHLYPKIFFRISPRFCNEPILLCKKDRSKIKVHLLRRIR